MFSLQDDLERDAAINIGKLRRQVHAKGTKRFGRGWNDARHALVGAVSHGLHQSLNDLDVAGLRRLLELLEAAPEAPVKAPVTTTNN